MWNEWLARTLKPRPAQAAAPPRAPDPAPVADGETGIDDVRPSTAALRAPAQDEEVRSLAAEV
jgi:hypothetical protein